MAFDNPTRNRLARLVSDCRRLLTDEFSIQLQQHYGVQPDGQIIPLEQLGHLDDEQRGVAVMLRERISHIASGLTAEKRPAEAAVDRLLREQAFTVLNRFAALRMCEERELVQECVRGGLHSRGFKVFLQIAGSGLGDTWQRYRTFLYLLFDEISIDLGLLFDRFSPFGLLFPREAALEELFQLLNTPDLQSIWSEDETIGWIYQYFNSKEERQAMRKASAAPRNSRELAVRNQFFTPRYVVEFLTDNTLGRTWYEMRQGQTRLTGQCRYLVRRPHEVFLQPGEEAPEPPANQDDLSQEELLNQPHHIAFRPKKDPRDLKILDPACGSGHFLLYAFDLLQTIYEEAWEDDSMPAGETTGLTLRHDYPDREKLLLAIPELILRHNLHGIDIDPRAVQIAALALWLRSQRAWKEQRVKPEERPRIRKSHIVCAEPMPGEKQMLREFAANLQPPLLGQIVERIFDRMQLAGEAGSLLKIEEEIQESISQAKEQWQRMYERARDKFGNQMLFTQSEMDNLRLDPQLLLGLFDVSQISDAEFWETIEERILAALREYAERSSGQSLSRRMFADDAAKGFAFIDLCRKRYDVVLMNPPFGECPDRINAYLKEKYVSGRPDAYMCFFFRSQILIDTLGFCGALTSKTFHTLEFYLPMRQIMIEGDLFLQKMVDLSSSVLDGATVETCAFVAQKSRIINSIQSAIFINVSEDQFKEKALQESVALIAQNKVNQQFFLRFLHWFSRMPGNILSYSLHKKVYTTFLNLPVLDSSTSLPSICENKLVFAELKQGMISGDLFRFGRLRTEVPVIQILHGNWIPICRGGDYHKYYYSENSVFAWANEGRVAKAYAKQNYGSESRTIKNTHHFRKPGFTYPRISSVGFNVRVMPAGYAFSDVGYAILPNQHVIRTSLIAYLNSRLSDYFANSLHPGRTFEISHISSIPINETIVKDDLLSEYGARSIALAREMDTWDELSPIYKLPQLMRTKEITIQNAWKSFEIQIRTLLSDYQKQLTSINNRVYELLGITNDEINEINNLYLLSGRSLEKLNDVNAIDEIRRAIEKWPEKYDFISVFSHKEYMNFIHSFFSYSSGLIVGRWDIRHGLDGSLIKAYLDPFVKLPISSPCTLIQPDGTPAKQDYIVSEEWLRARPDANSLPPEGSVKNPTIRDEEYPIRISWQGILVDDAFAAEGNTHQEDILRRTREVIEVLWKERAPAIEQEACEILGVKSLRDYFRKPGGFFQDHLKRYSKSRRQAPIYWPLSSENGNYTLWIYYHRLTDQFLYTCANDYVNPRIEEVTRDIEQFQKRQLAGALKSADSLKQLEALQDFLIELKNFRDELLAVAQLPYKPDLNDGVIITAAPLWKLFRLPKWRKDLKACWEKLQAGDYDWAHLTLAIWPDRVRGKCVTDKSLAIAHDLEHLYDESRAPRRRRSAPIEEENEEENIEDEN